MAKKNTTMRGAVLMLALTTITSCFVGGTLSKYTTSGSANDTARVAKWGLTITASEGSAFGKNYNGHIDNSSLLDGAYAVKSSTDEKVVAPGTNSTEHDSAPLTLSVNGTTEVATQLSAALNVTSDVSLTYTPNGGEASTYNPIKYTATVTDAAGNVVLYDETEYAQFTGATVAEINTALDTFFSNEGYQANTAIDRKVQIDWAWDFEKTGDGVTANDIALQNAMDTFLGDVAAGVKDGEGQAITTKTVEIGGTTYTFSAPNTSLAYTLDLTVTQVD